ncbi:MAG: glycosyltransferase family 39 protein [Nanoarchaeota archaeon]|nr:glycosyltransferase family 39 protein [Nanoarchaeota archaeon]
MGESEEITLRKEKIMNWIRKPSNLAFFGILVFAIVIRLYYFSMTLNQPLWWDEAEYMDMARHWAFGSSYIFDAVRQIFFPLIIAFFLGLGSDVLLPRLFLLGLSIASVIGVYYLGKEIYNTKIALLSCFFMSVFYLNIFFTYRLLVDIHSLTFFTFSALFFYRYLIKNSKKSLYIASVLIAIGTLFKLSTAFILPAVFIFLLVTEKLSFIKKKELWVAASIFLLILTPYFIWGYFEFNGFVLTKASAHVAPSDYFERFFGGSKDYFSLFPVYLSWPFLIVFLLGIALMYQLVLGFDILVKKGDKELKKYLYLFLILLLPILLASLMIDHNENRYIINSFPSIFIISSFFIIKSYNFIKNKNKFLAIFLVVVLLLFFAFFQLKSTDSLIKGKLNSYSEVREAGLWLKQNSAPSDIIVTSSHPQIKYYSEREIMPFPESEEEFELKLSSDKNLQFYIISAFEYHPEWSYTYPQRNNLTPINGYFADSEQKQPLLLIYKIGD